MVRFRWHLEHPVLLGGRQPGVQRQDVGTRAPAQRVGGVADLPLAGQEDEDVARSLPLKLADRVGDRGDLVPVLVASLPRSASALGIGHGPVADLDRVGAAGHLDDRGGLAGAGVGEVRGEPLRVDGRGGDDHLEVGAARQQLPQEAEDEVDVQAALVRLVDDEGVVAVQVRLARDLGEQDAVGHQLHGGGVAGLVGEPHLVPDHLAELRAEFLRDPFRDGTGGDAPRLGVADLAGDAAAELQADLGQLGRLARAGLAGHDHHLMVADRGGDVVPALADRQFFRVADGNARERGFAGRGAPVRRSRARAGRPAVRRGAVAAVAAVAVAGTAARPRGGRRRSCRGRFVHRRERLDDRGQMMPTLYLAALFPRPAGAWPRPAPVRNAKIRSSRRPPAPR